jgi:hypothetical protein
MNNSNTGFMIRKRPNTLLHQSANNINQKLSPCEKRFNAGLARVDYDDTIEELVSLRSWHNCRLSLGNQVFYLNTKHMNKMAFLETIPLLDTVPKENGVYLYIVWSNEENSKVLTCCKVLSILEMGTLHKIIALRKGAQIIHAAGELKIENEAPTFNLLSGSYMRETFQEPIVLKRRRVNMECDKDDLQNFIVQYMKEILGNQAQFTQGRDMTMNSYIKKSSLPVSLEELQMYESFGAILELFDSKEACFAKKDKVERNASGGKRRKTRRKRAFI